MKSIIYISILLSSTINFSEASEISKNPKSSDTLTPDDTIFYISNTERKQINFYHQINEEIQSEKKEVFSKLSSNNESINSIEVVYREHLKNYCNFYNAIQHRQHAEEREKRASLTWDFKPMNKDFLNFRKHLEDQEMKRLLTVYKDAEKKYNKVAKPIMLDAFKEAKNYVLFENGMSEEDYDNLSLHTNALLSSIKDVATIVYYDDDYDSSDDEGSITIPDKSL